MTIRDVPTVPNADEWFRDGQMGEAGHRWADLTAKVLDELKTGTTTNEEAIATLSATVSALSSTVGALSQGIVRQVRSPVYIGSPTSSGITLKTLASDSLTCLSANGRVSVLGNVGHSHAGTGSVSTGLQAYLYVDGSDSGIAAVQDWVAAGEEHNTPVSFMYTPGDTSAHTYSIRAESALSAIYGYSCWIQLSELGPNLTEV
jgi:hypothetical protein